MIYLYVRTCVYPTVQCVLRESQVIRESKEQQIAELKKMLEHSADSLTNECEKKVRSPKLKSFGEFPHNEQTICLKRRSAGLAAAAAGSLKLKPFIL